MRYRFKHGFDTEPAHFGSRNARSMSWKKARRLKHEARNLIKILISDFAFSANTLRTLRLTKFLNYRKKQVTNGIQNTTVISRRAMPLQTSLEERSIHKNGDFSFAALIRNDKNNWSWTLLGPYTKNPNLLVVQYE